MFFSYLLGILGTFCLLPHCAIHLDIYCAMLFPCRVTVKEKITVTLDYAIFELF
jgi:hypothetical protein